MRKVYIYQWATTDTVKNVNTYTGKCITCTNVKINWYVTMLHKVDYWHEKIYMCKNYKILNFSLGDFTEHQYLLGLLNTTKSRVFHLSEPLLSSWDTEKCILSCNVTTARRQTWQQVVAFDTELVLESVSVAFYRPSSEACCLTTFSFLTVMASSRAGTESPASAANTHHRPLDHQQCRLSTITAGLQQI